MFARYLAFDVAIRRSIADLPTSALKANVKRTTLLNATLAAAFAFAATTAAAADSYALRVLALGVRAAPSETLPPTQPQPSSFATFDPSTRYLSQLDAKRLTVTNPSGSVYGSVLGSIAKASGKWYWEIKLDVPSINSGFGICPAGTNLTTAGWPSHTGCITVWNGSLYVGQSRVKDAQANFNSTNVFGVALDLDAKTLQVYQNNAPVTPGILWPDVSVQPMVPVVSTQAATDSLTANFGASPFVYAPPAGYNAGLYQSL